MLKSSKLDSYGKFKIENQKKYKNSVWTSFSIIDKIKDYIKTHDLKFSQALDPCAGSGRIIQSFKEYNWTGYEIDENVYKDCVTDDNLKEKIKNIDFFETDCEIDKYDLCICNPPYNKVNVNKWLEHIFNNLCGYMFFIVPYNFINKVKESYKKLICDYIVCTNDMDQLYHNKVIVYVFNTENKTPYVFEDLFYIDIPERLKTDNVIYLKDYLDSIDVDMPKYMKIKDIPEGTKHPVYTVATDPVKYTDLNTSCPSDVMMFSNSFIETSISLKYCAEAPYLNHTYRIYKFKNEEAKQFILDNLFKIQRYMQEVFKYNVTKTLVKPEDVLILPIYISGKTEEDIYSEEFDKYVKKFKYYKNIKNINITFNY